MVSGLSSNFWSGDGVERPRSGWSAQLIPAFTLSASEWKSVHPCGSKGGRDGENGGGGSGGEVK